MGILIAMVGLIALGWVVWLWLHNEGPHYGFGWIMAALLIFSGTQLVMLGLIGEYVGRTYQVVRTRQRYHVREILEAKA